MPSPGVFSYKCRRFADRSTSQTGFLQPRSLQAGSVPRVMRSGLGETSSLPARYAAPADAPPAARFQRAEETADLEAPFGCCTCTFRALIWVLNTRRFPLAGFYGRKVRRLLLAPAAEGVTWRQVTRPLPARNHSPAPAGEFEPCRSGWQRHRGPRGASHRPGKDGRGRLRQTLPEKVPRPLHAEIPALGKRRAGRGGEDFLCPLPGPAKNNL